MAQKILVVDDSSEFTFLLSTLLKFHDIDVTSVNDGVSALNSLNSDNYGLLITDYMMPEMNGLQLCSKVRSIPRLLEIPILVITAKEFDTGEMSLVKELHLNYVRKPIVPNQLYKKILSLLGEGE